MNEQTLFTAALEHDPGARSTYLDDSIAALEKSIELQRDGGDSFQWFFLAMSHGQLDETEEARKWYDRAVEWIEKNKSNDEELRRFGSEAAELLKIDGLRAQTDGLFILSQTTFK